MAKYPEDNMQTEALRPFITDKRITMTTRIEEALPFLERSVFYSNYMVGYQYHLKDKVHLIEYPDVFPYLSPRILDTYIINIKYFDDHSCDEYTINIPNLGPDLYSTMGLDELIDCMTYLLSYIALHAGLDVICDDMRAVKQYLDDKGISYKMGLK